MVKDCRVIRTGLYGETARQIFTAYFGRPCDQTDFDTCGSRKCGVNAEKWFMISGQWTTGRLIQWMKRWMSFTFDYNGEICVPSRQWGAYAGKNDADARAWLADSIKCFVKMQYGFSKFGEAKTRAADGWRADNYEPAFTWALNLEKRRFEKNEQPDVVYNPEWASVPVSAVYALYEALKFGPRAVDKSPWRDAIVGEPRDAIDTEMRAAAAEERELLAQEHDAATLAINTRYSKESNVEYADFNRRSDEIQKRCNAEMEALRAEHRERVKDIDARRSAEHEAENARYAEARAKLDAELA